MQTTVPNRQIFPASLFVEDRACLIVGGGKIAAHKASLLLQAGAVVTIVAPQLGPALLALVDAQKLCWRPREFAPQDVDGAFLAFAATNDRSVNRQVLQACQQAHVLCCCVDGNWVNSDFVTPATLRTDELTVAVSTAGRSCRRSRLVKANLSRHIEMVATADLLVLGTSHNYLHVDQREPYHLNGARLQQASAMIMQVWGVHEFMLLNTCNRIELMAVVAQQAPPLLPLLQRILGFDHLQPDSYYCKNGYDAFAHSAVLSAGLLSQTPGEKHIVAQLKDTFNTAGAAGYAGAMMQEWVNSTLHLSKLIREHTSPLLRNEEVEDLCLNFLAAGQGQLSQQRILLLGAGMVGKELLSRLQQFGCQVDWCYHVNRPELPAAWQPQVRLGTFNELRHWLPQADVIICATGSSGHVLHCGHAPFFDQEKPVRIVDLSMPRNVAPTLHGLMANVTVTDLEDLKHWYRRCAADMAQVFEISKNVVDEHRQLYDKILYHFQGGNAQQ